MAANGDSTNTKEEPKVEDPKDGDTKMEKEEPKGDESKTDVKPQPDAVKEEDKPKEAKENENGVTNGEPAKTGDVTDEMLAKRIRELLPSLDLTTASAKSVRKMLEDEFKVKLSAKKKFISKTLLKCMDDQDDGQKKESKKRKKKGSDDESTEKKSKKKKETKKKTEKKKGSQKKSKSKKDDEGDDDPDRALALELNAENTRPRRQAARKQLDKYAKNRQREEKRKAKPKSAKKPPRKLILSPDLAAFIGEKQMSRPDVVKKLWVYIKEKNLQDPSDKRKILLDETLQTVFKGRKHVTMFSMAKYLSPLLKKPEEIVASALDDESEEDEGEKEEEEAED